jgi:hypothetical protein
MTNKDTNAFALSDGTEVNFDFSKITRKEYRAIFDPTQSNKEGDATVTKITGLTDLDELNQLDWSRLLREIATRANRPDPT